MTAARCPRSCPLVVGRVWRQREFATGRGTRLRMHLDPARIVVSQNRLLIDLFFTVSTAYNIVILLLYMVTRDVVIPVIELHTVRVSHVTFGSGHNRGW